MSDWLWFVLGACVVGLITTIFAPSLNMQLVLFASLSATFVMYGRYFNFYKTQSDSHPHLNNVMDEYIGREVALFTAIHEGVGQVKIGDSLWNVTGEDAPIGTKVKLIGINGQNFIVRAYSFHID
jgi:inner membrane protein